jgi:hypothetical protein
MRKKSRSSAWLILLVMTLAAWPNEIRAQKSFEQVTGKEFERAVPKDFYLEGNAIPVEVRNATLLKTGGARALFALIDTTGYSSQIRQKYIGMLISESSISICGKSVHVGSYGFGLERPAETSLKEAKFFMYDQAGEKVVECNAKRDSKIRQPKPLQAVLIQGVPARLYLGRYWVDLK